MNQQSLDIVSVFVFAATLIFAPTMAAVIGPYLAIVLASTIGASFALARRESSSRGDAMMFFVRINGLAILLTVGLAAATRMWRPDLPESLLLVPIALLVGFVGDDWPKMLSKLLRMVYAGLDLLRPKDKE